MSSFFLAIYRFVFCRPVFYKFNLHLYKMSLRGIGVLNSEGPRATGEQWLMERLAATGNINTIVDVGANTDVFGAAEFPHATIFAIEPHPETFQKLRHRVRQHNWHHVKLINLAISNKKGTYKLWDFADDAELKSTQPTSTLASLNRNVIEKLHHQKAKSFTVKTETLDHVAARLKLKNIDLLKIDTEGHELAVLEGTKKLLASHAISLIQFEFNEMNVFSRSYLKDFSDLLPNYRFYRLMPNGLFPLGEYRPLTHEIFGFQNILAVAKDTNILL